jgi:hypothetical protein
MPRLNGTMVDENGVVEVAASGTVVAMIDGTAHDSRGRMLVAEDSAVPGASAGGIRHTLDGFRCISEGAIVGYTRDGFAIDAAGAQVVTREAPTRRIKGLGVDDDGRLCIHDE